MMATSIEQEMATCSHCKGTGRLQVKSTTIAAGGVSHDVVDMMCIWCEGTGSRTQAEAEAEKKEMALWCKCNNPSGRGAIFKDDGQCKPDCYRKHHWHCPDCGGVVQVG